MKGNPRKINGILAPLVLDSSIKVPLLQASTSYKTITVRLCSHHCPQPPMGTHPPHFTTLPLCPNPFSYHKYQSNRRGGLRGRVYIFICISFRTTFSLSELFYAFFPRLIDAIYPPSTLSVPGPESQKEVTFGEMF